MTHGEVKIIICELYKHCNHTFKVKTQMRCHERCDGKIIYQINRNEKIWLSVYFCVNACTCLLMTTSSYFECTRMMH